MKLLRALGLRRKKTPVQSDKKSVPNESLNRIHEYWRAPDDGMNQPSKYAEAPVERSKFLVQKVAGLVSKDAKILEIGCNTGRNLAFLRQAGFRNVSAIEISEAAIVNLRAAYPELVDVSVVNLPVEDVARAWGDKEFDLIITMAVLEHIHTDSEWIFAEMARAGKRLITIEDERTTSWRHFTREYQAVFEALGMKQIDSADGVDGLPKQFRYRAFHHGF